MPYVSDESEFKANEAAVVRFLCRHLVSLAGWYQPIDNAGNPIGENQFFSYSGFILSIQGMWNFATAGHILEELEQHLGNKTIRANEFMLADTFGSGAISQYSIPFPYPKSPKLYIYDQDLGLDFGLVILDQHYKNLLQANGIVAVEEENWKNIPSELADKYIMLGLPQNLIGTQQIKDGKILRQIGKVAPTAVGITKLNDNIENIPQTKYPRFIGKLNDEGYLVDDITGMSGGPIIGFSQDYRRYWVTALQSGWLRERRITFGCPIPIFAQLVENWLTQSEQPKGERE